MRRLAPLLLALLACACSDVGLVALSDGTAEVPGAGPVVPTDPADPDLACPVPVPDHADLAAPVWGEQPVHFYVPEPGWAFATALVSSMFASDQADADSDLRLDPSFLFATALKESFLGCSDDVLADPLHPEQSFARQPAADHDGCFQIEATTAWTELCRLYPDRVDCDEVAFEDVISSQHQDQTGRDNFETGVFAAAMYDVFAHAMLLNHGTDDPDAWFAAAADPLAAEKVLALLYNRGAWSPELSQVIQGCHQDPIEDCVTPESVAWDYVVAVGSYTADLRAALAEGSCYDADMELADVHDLVDALEPLLPGEDWPALRAAAAEAFELAATDDVGFQQVAPVVIEVLADGLELRFDCPGAQLEAWYGASCPP